MRGGYARLGKEHRCGLWNVICDNMYLALSKHRQEEWIGETSRRLQINRRFILGSYPREAGQQLGTGDLELIRSLKSIVTGLFDALKS